MSSDDDATIELRVIALVRACASGDREAVGVLTSGVDPEDYARMFRTLLHRAALDMVGKGLRERLVSGEPLDDDGNWSWVEMVNPVADQMVAEVLEHYTGPDGWYSEMQMRSAGKPVKLADPQDYGLTAADLHAVADRLYDAGDVRLDPMNDVSQRFGMIRSRLRGLADAIGEDEHEQPPKGGRPWKKK